MKIRIIRDQEVDGLGVLTAGQTADLDTKLAKLLINRGIGKEQIENRAVKTPKKARK